MKKTLLKNFIQAVLAAGFLFVCYLLGYLIVGNELLIPSPWETLKETWALFLKVSFWNGVASTLLRVAIAFSISFVLAVGFAVVSYLYPTFEYFLMPIVSALRSLPVLAVLLILLSVLGAGSAPIAVAFLSLFPMLYVGVLTALSGVDKQLIEISRVFGTPVYRRVFGIYLPLSAPYVLREAAAALSFALKLVVSAEVVAFTARSLGGMLQEARIYDVPQLFALVALTFLIGFILEALIGWIASAVEKKVK